MGKTARHGVSQGRSCASPWASSGRQDFPRIRPPSGVSVFPPVIVRRLRRLRAALVRTVHCSSHAHRPVSLVPPTISGRIPVFLRYINIYISIIAGSRDAYFAGTRHCARATSRCATPHRVTHDENPCNHWALGISSLCEGSRSVTTGRNIGHRPTVWRGTIFGSRHARHHPQLTGRAARSRLSPHARRLTDASRRPSAKTRYRYSVNFREAAAPVVVKSEPLDCSEATAVTLCEPGASAFGRRTVQTPAFPTIAT